LKEEICSFRATCAHIFESLAPALASSFLSLFVCLFLLFLLFLGLTNYILLQNHQYPAAIKTYILTLPFLIFPNGAFYLKITADQRSPLSRSHVLTQMMFLFLLVFFVFGASWDLFLHSI
jgi:hypothetical protein